MRKSTFGALLRCYTLGIRRYALRGALAFLILYLVCDYLAQIRPLTVGTLVETCQRDLATLLTRMSSSEPPDYLTPFSLHSTSDPKKPSRSKTGHSSSTSLFKVKVYSPDGQTREFIKTRYETQVAERKMSLVER